MQLTIKSGQVIVVAPNGDGSSISVVIYRKENAMKAEFSFDLNTINAHYFVQAIKDAVNRIPEAIR